MMPCMDIPCAPSEPLAVVKIDVPPSSSGQEAGLSTR